MLAIAATEHLTGAHISGDYWDLDELLAAIKTVIGDEKRYYDYEAARSRILQFCMKLRDAIDGDEHVEFIANGVNDGILKKHEILAPKKNIYFAVDILLPEVVFTTIALNDFIALYEEHEGRDVWDPVIATIHKFQSMIALFLKDCMPANDYAFFMQQLQQTKPAFFRYATQFVDVMNIEYLKLSKGEREQRMSQFVIGYVHENPSYEALKNQLLQITSQSKKALHELPLKIEYPEKIIW